MLSVAMETQYNTYPPPCPSRSLSLPPLVSAYVSLPLFIHTKALWATLRMYGQSNRALHRLQDGENTSGLPPDSPLNSL